MPNGTPTVRERSFYITFSASSGLPTSPKPSESQSVVEPGILITKIFRSFFPQTQDAEGLLNIIHKSKSFSNSRGYCIFSVPSRSVRSPDVTVAMRDARERERECVCVCGDHPTRTGKLHARISPRVQIGARRED